LASLFSHDEYLENNQDSSEYFLDSNHAWMCETSGPYPRLYRTTDGGGRWYRSTPGVHQFASLTFGFFNTRISLLAANIDLPGDSKTWFYSTHDGCISWKAFTGNHPIRSIVPSGIVFQSLTRCYIYGSLAEVPTGKAALYKSFDGGRNWLPQKLAVPPHYWIAWTRKPAFSGKAGSQGTLLVDWASIHQINSRVPLLIRI
jgi:photosystem II stability/assembly factor-like uncharacterized protein